MHGLGMFSPQCIYFLFRKAEAINEKDVQMRRCKFCQVKSKHTLTHHVSVKCTLTYLYEYALDNTDFFPATTDSYTFY